MLGDILQGDLGCPTWLSMPFPCLASFGNPCTPICRCFAKIDADVGQRGSGLGKRKGERGKRGKRMLRAGNRSQGSRGRGLLQIWFNQSPRLIGTSLLDLVKDLVCRVPCLSG